MVRVNNSVGRVARRSVDTNELHHPQAHEPTRHLYLSDMRHTSPFPHHNASNFCNSQGLMQDKGWYPWTRVSDG